MEYLIIVSLFLSLKELNGLLYGIGVFRFCYKWTFKGEHLKLRNLSPMRPFVVT